MAEGSRFRGWYQGAPYTGALLNMNNCPLERQNEDLKETIEKNSPLNRFFLKTGTWLRDKSLAKNPANPNYAPFQVSATITPKLWVEGNYIFTESKRTEEHRFFHILPAFVDGAPVVTQLVHVKYIYCASLYHDRPATNTSVTNTPVRIRVRV